MKELLGDYEGFVTNISDGLSRSGIGRDEIAMMDHICYRVETLERYGVVKAALGKRAFLLGESMVSGRLIATFECDEPLQVDGWTIPYIELPQPKEGSLYPEGLEHVELVPYHTLRKFQKMHSGLPFSEVGMNKLINPELGLKHQGISVKFHEQPLGAVVNIERRLEGRIQL